jgi:peptidoglycan hydrolase CwlO-like protein
MEMSDKIIYILSTVGVSFITYLFGARKRSLEYESAKLSNLEKSLEIYQTMINDMSDKIEMLTMKIEELEATVERLYKENKQLKQKVK